MMIRNTLTACMAFGLTTILATTASAATIGADVGISSISPCPSFCGGSGGTFDSAFDGGEGSSFASTSLDNVGTLNHGSGAAEAGFNGPNLLPILRGESYAQPNARVGTGSTAYRLYNYSGADTTLQLDITLEGEAMSAAALDAAIRARVAIVTGSDLPHSTDASTFLFEVVPLTDGIDLCGSAADVSISNNAGPQTVTATVSCDITDGQDFFVWANLTTRGTRGGSADSFNSLTASWVDASGITVVPEPSTALLVLGGLVGLSARRRR